MYIQKDIYPQILANYSKFNEQRTEVDYSENGIVKPMKPTTKINFKSTYIIFEE